MLELALLRSKFQNEKWDNSDLISLCHIENEIKGSISPFRDLILNSLNNAICDIRRQNPQGAARELNLVHNLGLSSDWSSEKAKRYFYFAELPDYLGEVGDLNRVKTVLLLASKLI